MDRINKKRGIFTLALTAAIFLAACSSSSDNDSSGPDFDQNGTVGDLHIVDTFEADNLISARQETGDAFAVASNSTNRDAA